MGDRRKRTEDNRRIDERFLKVPIKGQAAELPRAVTVPLTADELARLDVWIARQKDNPSRAEAIRALMAQALESSDIANRRR